MTLQQWFDRALAQWKNVSVTSLASGSSAKVLGECDADCASYIFSALRMKGSDTLDHYVKSATAAEKTGRQLDMVVERLRYLQRVQPDAYHTLMQKQYPTLQDVEQAFEVPRSASSVPTPVAGSAEDFVCLVRILSDLHAWKPHPQAATSRCPLSQSTEVAKVYARCLFWASTHLPHKDWTDLNERIHTNRIEMSEFSVNDATIRFLQFLNVTPAEEHTSIAPQRIADIKKVVLDLLALVHLRCSRYMSVKMSDLKSTAEETVARQIFASRAAQIARGHVQPLHHFFENALSKLRR